MIFAFLIWLSIQSSGEDWGFFGHRLINRVAVYTLPTEMIGWYKPHIDYLSEHAVDPDKRRYATKHEAVRHYMDLDHWGKGNFDHVPRFWDQALAMNLIAYQLHTDDTIFYLEPIPVENWNDSIEDLPQRLQIVRQLYLPHYYDDEPEVDCDTLNQLYPMLCHLDGEVRLGDGLSEHGIIPYHLQSMQRRLTNAFKDNNLESIMRLSAEIGHYIGDACVPLHTTTNYNGQLTNQVGIHAFWESRIPELFALEEFDMVVGSATYIEDPVSYYWNLVLDSHQEVDRVLGLEKELSVTYPTDKQFCFEDRANQNIRTQCSAYAEAYHLAMDKMVEDRFRVAVKALGDAWYTAWIDAGQPTPPENISIAKRTAEDEEIDEAVQRGKGRGRDHE
ncbi:MAG: zinc dependent phospholipase C family protein [Saprospiraceae bacterium]